MDVTLLGDTGFACSALPPASLNGSFALIENNPAAPVCDFYTAALNAQEAGATGVIFYMASSEMPVNPEFVEFLGPVVMISNQAGVALKSFIDANPGQIVAIDKAGSEQDLTAFSQLWNFSPALMSNQLASYSSVGPAPDGSIKPDLVATGGFDAAQYPDLSDVGLPAPNGMYSAGQRYDPNGEVYSTNGYVAADGTSNAAPLTAGAAALVKQAHPNFTATQIKSALVNGAAQSVTTDDFGGSRGRAVHWSWLTGCWSRSESDSHSGALQCFFRLPDYRRLARSEVHRHYQQRDQFRYLVRVGVSKLRGSGNQRDGRSIGGNSIGRRQGDADRGHHWNNPCGR